MRENYKKRILDNLKKNGNGPVPYKALLRSCKVKKGDFEIYTKVLEGMKKRGELYETERGISTVDKAGLVKAEISRLNKTYGFATNIADKSEIFIPGRFFKGSMPGDTVLVRTFKGDGTSLEGEVVEVVEESFSQFTGVVVVEFGEYRAMPDKISKFSLKIENIYEMDISSGDKVLCEISSRGFRHSEHKCRVLTNFGSSDKASACAASYLELNGISAEFPTDVLREARYVSEKDISSDEIAKRVDLTDEIIFTIDGADTKDIDDAISIKKLDDGYELSVHIADVSHYVKPKTELDNEAFERGTSVYYANRVIPMLPKELSNGICSLNPKEVRLAFSVRMHIDEQGEIGEYEFFKSVIKSKLQGVYSEINSILDNTATDEVKEKYQEVNESLLIMNELAEVLNRAKKTRGVPSLESSESKLIIDENDICVDIKPRQSGVSEEIIEDFMLCANQCAARLAKEAELPFVYRVHENPSPEKVTTFAQAMSALNVQLPEFKNIKPIHLSQVLSEVKGADIEMIVNNLVLRSMAKAKYSAEPLGHFGLVLDDYAHFTSPIRRYPDLTIHRIMSEFLNGATQGELNKRFQKFVFASSAQSTETELKAMTVERDCEDCYKAEYMTQHIGEEFDGVISSVMEFGIFVMLPNTCEGLIRVNGLGDGKFTLENIIRLRNENTGEIFRVGDKVRIVVDRAVVSSGDIDFSLVKNKPTEI